MSDANLLSAASSFTSFGFIFTFNTEPPVSLRWFRLATDRRVAVTPLTFLPWCGEIPPSANGSPAFLPSGNVPRPPNARILRYLVTEVSDHLIDNGVDILVAITELGRVPQQVQNFLLVL